MFDRDRTFMVRMIQAMITRVFLNTDAGSHEEEDHQGLGKAVDNAGQYHERRVTGLPYGKSQKTLRKGCQKHQKGDQAQYITSVHEKPHGNNPIE